MPELGCVAGLVDIQEFALQIKELSHDVLHFLFKALTAREIFRTLCQDYERMRISSYIRSRPDGHGFETIENPDYPIYQVYLLEHSESGQANDDEDSEEPLYGGSIELTFIRYMLREKLLETSTDYSLLYYSIDIAAERFLAEFFQRNGMDSDGVERSADRPFALFSGGKLNDIHQDLADATDSIKAGQMEILRALQTKRQARDFLPLIESRLGSVFTKLHHETQRLLALGEYFLSINQGEPDAMNSVVLNQAKACEHELYMRIFGPYLSKLFSEGARNYPPDGSSRFSLILEGKEQPRSLNFGSYAWYLKYDLRLRTWILEELDLQPEHLSAEAYWLSQQRNNAAHEADFKSFNAAVFQSRVYGPQGLLTSIHSGR